MNKNNNGNGNGIGNGNGFNLRTIAIVGLLLTLHGGLVIPAILYQSGELTDNKIDRHSKAHATFQRALQNRLERIEARLDKIIDSR